MGQRKRAANRRRLRLILSQNQKSAENGTEETGGKARESADPEEVKENLLAFGTARMTNDTGEYKLTLREKYKAGRFLATVERDGKRLQAKTFASEREAAEWAVGVVEGQTRARTDAELDRHKSERKAGPTFTQQLFGDFDPEAEAIRQKENKAADAATQTLRERVRRTQEEINALNRLERTTGGSKLFVKSCCKKTCSSFLRNSLIE